MPTTVTPGAGVAPTFLQLGPGATDSYGAIDLRRGLLASPLQEGVLSAGAYKVTAGGAMDVSIAASTGEGALVLGDNVAAQGLYYVPPHSAAIVEAITASHASLPRVDQVVLEVLDANHDGGASNAVRVRVVNGTATSGATLDNAHTTGGAAALPNNAVRLADVLVPAASASVSASNIRDRRPWARGAYSIKSVNADISTASTSSVQVHSTLQARIEASGVPLRVALEAGSMNNNNTGAATFISLYLNGVESAQRKANTPAVSYELPTPPAFEFLPTPGSLLIQMFWKVSSGTSNLLRLITAGNVRLVVQESVRPNAAND